MSLAIQNFYAVNNRVFGAATAGLQSVIMPGNIVVRGDGVAALCCNHLLGKAGLTMSEEGPARPKLPAVMLSQGTQKLLRDVFDQTDLFEGATQIHKRIVAWGLDAEPVILPHSAVVLSEQELLGRIRQREIWEPKERHEEQAA